MRRADYLPLCSIAGWDPTGGAGAAADIRVFSAHQGHGTAVITALTVQTQSDGITQLQPVAADLVRAQIGAVRSQSEPRAWKIGMLPSAEVVRAVAAGIQGSDAPVILDPVMGASAGGERARDDTAQAMWSGLLPLVTLVTPNVAEALAMTGLATVDAASQALLEAGAAAVLVTGGDGDHAETVTDLLVRPETPPLVLEHERIAGGPFHGTGCALSSAIAVRLAQGASLDEAIRAAQQYVHALLALAGQSGAWLLSHLAVRPS